MRPRVYHCYGAGQFSAQPSVGAVGPEGPMFSHRPPSTGYCQDYPRPPPSSSQQEQRSPLRRTIFITNLPLTIDNGLRLLPYVPREGLFELRVKRSGGRDVGFAEYETGDCALHALRWFQKVAVTAQIAYDCSKSNSRSWAPSQPQFRYPVPYEEYNRCEADPVHSTELLLNSVILIAEWSLSSPTCRPKYLPSTLSGPLSNTLVAPHGCRACPDSAAAFHLASAGSVGWQAQLAPPPAGPRYLSVPNECLGHYAPPRAPVHVNHYATLGHGGAGTHQCGNGGNSECLLGDDAALQGGVTLLPQQHVNEAFFPNQGEWGKGGGVCEGRVVAHGDHFVSGSSSGDVATPTLLRDELLPSSTLFVRVTGGKRRSPSKNNSQRCGESSAPLRCFSSTVSLDSTSPSLTDECVKLSALGHQRIGGQERQQLRLLREWWSRFHHRHLISAERVLVVNHSAAESSCNEMSSPPTSLCDETINGLRDDGAAPTCASDAPSVTDAGGAEALVLTILNPDFYSERFAGFRSYVSFSRWSAFVRFERPMDALQCLRWLRQQPVLRDLVGVQFAREDTRQPRPSKRKKK